MQKKLIFVCSPFHGATDEETQANLDLAALACLTVIDKGHVPFAPHLFYPSFLDDSHPRARRRGIECGLEILRRCDELWIFGDTVSAGMQQEISFAYAHEITVRKHLWEDEN